MNSPQMNKKIKIAFFSGPIEYSVCLANALSTHCEVHFYYNERYAKQRDAMILNLLDQGIKRVPISDYRIRDFRNIVKYYRIAKRLRTFDIVHIQIADIWLAVWRFLFRKVPIICTIHDPYQHYGLKKMNSLYQDLSQKLCIIQSKKYIVHGLIMKKDLARRYKLSKDKISIIPHGEFSFYNVFKSNKELLIKKDALSKRILFFGTIRENKGLEYLIKAEPIISSVVSNYKICIAGKFPENLQFYKNLIKNPDKFEILDEYIAIDQVAHLFEKSQIVVLPYITATQSGVLPLAFAFGKPVIATNTGSISEVLEDKKTGFLVPPKDERSLASAIIDLILDEKKCAVFGRNARLVANDKLNWSRIGVSTVSLYEELLCAEKN